MQIYEWNKEGFETAYWKYFYKLRGCGAAKPHWCKCSDKYITYSRDFFETNEMFTTRARSIVSRLNLKNADKVLVVGAALGYLNEELNALGMHSYAIDNSQYIQTIKGKEKAKTDVRNIDILDSAFVSKIKRAFNIDKFDCIITEDVLPSHDSYTQIFLNCETVLNSTNFKKIVHVVETNASSPFISKSLNEWQQLKPTHTWLNSIGEG